MSLIGEVLGLFIALNRGPAVHQPSDDSSMNGIEHGIIADEKQDTVEFDIRFHEKVAIANGSTIRFKSLAQLLEVSFVNRESGVPGHCSFNELTGIEKILQLFLLTDHHAHH